MRPDFCHRRNAEAYCGVVDLRDEIHAVGGLENMAVAPVSPAVEEPDDDATHLAAAEDGLTVCGLASAERNIATDAGDVDCWECQRGAVEEPEWTPESVEYVTAGWPDVEEPERITVEARQCPACGAITDRSEHCHRRPSPLFPQLDEAEDTVPVLVHVVDYLCHPRMWVDPERRERTCARGTKACEVDHAALAGSLSQETK